MGTGGRMNLESLTLLEQLKYWNKVYEDLPSCVCLEEKTNEAKTLFLKPILQDEYEKLGKELGVELE